MKDAPILILDEASASLDTQSEQHIQNAIVEGSTGKEGSAGNKAGKEGATGKTIITVAHRLSTIENADCIFVMENGCVVEHGTHVELLAANGVYKNLHNRNSN